MKAVALLLLLAAPELRSGYWRIWDRHGCTRFSASDRTLTTELSDHPTPTGYDVSFTLDAADGGWRLRSPRVTDPYSGAWLYALCVRELLPADPTLYPDRASCERDGGAFDLGACDQPLRAAMGTLYVLANATEAQRLATLEAVLQRWKAGGALYSDPPECRKWRVVPNGELRAKLSSAGEDRDVQIAPLSGRSQALSVTYRTPNGGGGGSGAGPWEPFYFGNGRFLLGDRWFFLDHATCAR